MTEMDGRTWVGKDGPYDFDGRPIADTLDAKGSALPGCTQESHARNDGQHSMMCFIALLDYHKDGDVWRKDPPHPEAAVGFVIEHEGGVYIRPLARGVVLEGYGGAEDRYLDDFPEGRYRGIVRLERIAETPD